MPDQINARIEDCYRLAEDFFACRFPRPQVNLRLRGQKAGVAHLQENLLRFNQQLYQANQAHFLKHTVAHEVAHLIAHQMFGSRIRPHGPEWQEIMIGVYGLPAERCHTYEINVKRKTEYLYHCQCLERNEFPFSSRRHAMVQKGRSYYCRRCRATLVFSGSTTDQSN